MAKTITVTKAVLEEILIQPNKVTPLAVSYNTYDSNNEMVYGKRISVDYSIFSKKELASLTELSAKLLDHIETLEGIKN